ncbi:MAG: iron-containing alcohol dehydrogenase, partial [Rikenellaceae bacterium]
MNNFQFKNPTKLIFGKGEIAKIAKEIAKDKKIMITYGGGSIKRNGVYDQVTTALKDHNFIEFGSIEPNPQYSTLMKAADLARKEGVDFLLAVGGGSVIDGTKFIACAMNFHGDPWSFLVDQSLLKHIIPTPLATVLTLPATASEMNCGAVISRSEIGEKLAFQHALNYPVFSVLDPQVCYSLPAVQRSNGIADTFCHTLEQYLTYPSKSMIQDRFAEGILLTLKEIGVSLLEKDNDYDLMANFMLSATMGLNGFIAMGVPEDWATHMIGHELTALYGLDHAVTLAIVGPSLMNVMRDEKSDKLLQYGERVWGINSGGKKERIDATIAATRNFYESIGIKTHLSDYNIASEKFELIADRFRQRGWNLGERGTITPSKVLEILNGA